MKGGACGWVTVRNKRCLVGGSGNGGGIDGVAVHGGRRYRPPGGLFGKLRWKRQVPCGSGLGARKSWNDEVFIIGSEARARHTFGGLMVSWGLSPNLSLLGAYGMIDVPPRV